MRDGPDSDAATAAAVDAHTRLLTSRVGRVGVAVVLAVTAVWIIGPNMPAGPARDAVAVVWSPAVDAGFDQSWEVFSPDPRSETIEVVALLDYDNGATAEWRIPDLDPVVGPLREYRWQKWQELIRLDENQAWWASTAVWIAEHNRIDGRLPASVRLVRRWQPIEPLTAGHGGTDSDPGEVFEYEFHVWTRSD